MMIVKPNHMTIAGIFICLTSCSQPHTPPSGATANNDLETFKTHKCISEATEQKGNATLSDWNDCDKKAISYETEEEYRKYKKEIEIYTTKQY